MLHLTCEKDLRNSICCSVFFLNIYFAADKIKTRNKDFYTVTEVTDGDTFVTNTGAKVRILGIDAPKPDYADRGRLKIFWKN